jgi:uncharacterized protein YaiL (DUF2058 family)
MAEERESRGRIAPKAADSQPKPKEKTAAGKNAAALSAALRANLARRKARERALRAGKNSDSEG